MKQHRPEALRHYPALDGLRGLAILMVILHHFLDDHPFQSSVYQASAQMVWSFWTGVDLFFVLSGFLITRILLATRGQPGYFYQFYVRRVLRIFPLYFIVVLSSIYLLPLVGMGLEESTRSVAPYYLTFTSNIHAAFHGWTSQPLDLVWSLAIEEQFYLLWPLLIAILRPRQLRFAALTYLCVLPIVRYAAGHAGLSEVFLYTMLPTHCDGLLIGSLLAMLSLRITITKVPASLAIGVSVGTLLFLMMGSFHLAGITVSPSDWTLREATFYYSLLAILFGAQLLFAIGPSNPMQHFYCAPALRWLGKYSYALYLLHRVVAWVVERTLERTGMTHALTGSFWHESLYLLLIAGTTLLAARLSWSLIEQPFLRLKKHFPYRSAEAL